MSLELDALPGRFTLEDHLDAVAARARVVREVREGLLGSPRTLPSRLFYDAAGSRLFRRITRLPEYYLTRAEIGLLRRQAARLAGRTAAADLVELGPGGTTKTQIVADALAAAGTLRRYVPIEVTREVVEASGPAIVRRYPGVHVHGVLADFGEQMPRLDRVGPRLVLFLGSTIGNFDREGAHRLLAAIRGQLAPGDHLLLGTDLVKERAVLEAAYNDVRGVTAAFNRNILRVVNRSFRGNFVVAAWGHEARYDARHRRVEMWLRSTRPQAVSVADAGIGIEIGAGEGIRTEVSAKYTRRVVGGMLRRAGLRLVEWLESPPPGFALSLAEPV